MKCLFFFLSILLFISNVASLDILIQNPTTPGTSTLVVWTRAQSDDASQAIQFDLRFVQEPGDSDVGIALSNIMLNAGVQFGNANIYFPSAGQFVVKAVSGPSFTVIGTSNAVTVASSSAPSITQSASTTATDAQSTGSTASASPTTSNTPTATTTNGSVTPSPSSSTSPTTAASPSSGTASSPSSSGTTQPTQTSFLASTVAHPNLPAIVGGVIGGLIILAIMATLIIFLARRRAVIKKRLTFHRDMMVQPNPHLAVLNLQMPPPSPRICVTPPPPPTDRDLEQGFSPQILVPPSPIGARTPQGLGHVVPSPRGPRPSIKRDVVTTIIRPHTPVESAPARTRRQKELLDRIAMLRRQIAEIEGQGGAAPHSEHVLEDMNRQIAWLNEHENSPWALGLTDVLPAGYARHMTP